MSLPPAIARLFHNYRPEAMDLDADAEWIILTVLRDGSWSDWQWLFATYGWERIASVVRRDLDGLRTLPHAVAHFWSVVFWGEPLPRPTARDRWGPPRRIPPSVSDPS
jgi:hypothetical protein